MKSKQLVKRSHKLSSALRKGEANSRLPEQIELSFAGTRSLTSILSLRERRTTQSPGEGGSLAFSRVEDVDLTRKVRELLRKFGINTVVRVEWNSRLRSCAGRATYRDKLITLNPRLREHGADEIDRTIRHELAHLLAQFRAGRRRVSPHGSEWRKACHDLGIGDEKRCHNLPFPISHRARRYLYKCPNCRRDFPRVRRIKRAIACLACCRAHNRGEFDARFKLRLVHL